MPLKNDYGTKDDDSLVRVAKQGDMEAFEELVARHRDKLYARAFSIVRNEEEAIDLSQEAWVKAWQKLGQFKGGASFLTWVTRIVINLCLDHLRKRKQPVSLSLEQLDEEIGGVERLTPIITIDPTAGLSQEELRRRIDDAMGKLTYAHRTVLILYEFEGLDYKEIAKKMRCSIGTVMSRLFYARRRLAALLADLQQERQQ